ncbi:hypothetical protein DD681_00125 [Buchnera aphidicola (Melanaphis sacchari)]|uniref:Uncharacterized protein n=1 Tax=Buchnera aphidicola (Melanaphis sacchari) TaxID=2173854 RepID=A0A2U8DEQ4_9GAMM|nr:hypothetical protein [Buchnera aphidicola]AWH90243.1 hypothetical protein DD681_00125 [Buchnera aphidicola (Melanaphis sacchari)]
MSSNITLVDKLNPTRFYETLNKKNINSKVLKDTKNKTQNDQNPIFYLKEKDLYLLNASDVNKKNDYEDVEIKLINKINEDLNNLNIIEDIMKKKLFLNPL